MIREETRKNERMNKDEVRGDEGRRKDTRPEKMS